MSSLKPLHTFGLNHTAESISYLATPSDFQELVGLALNTDFILLGSGSNVVFLEDISIPVFINRFYGKTLEETNEIRENIRNFNSIAWRIMPVNQYLVDDIQSLNVNFNPIYEKESLEIFEKQKDDNLNIKIVDKSLKKRGILLSSAQRNEIIKQSEITISDKINISISTEYIYICPKTKNTMDKKFKEVCRVLKVPKNIRAYLFEKSIEPKDLFF